MNVNFKDKVRLEVEESIAIKEALLRDEAILEQISSTVNACLASLKKGGRVIFCGNGGSFADAQHLSAEFVSRFKFDRAPLPSVVLGANCSAMSAIGNDYGYEQVFARELQGLADEKDVFIPISTSGNSPNVIEAVKVAKNMKMTTTALTGGSSGRLKSCCDCICVPSEDTARIQESHIMIGHIICGLVEEYYFG